MANKRGEFARLEDGYYHYFPEGNGGISSDILRILADELDRMNKPWDDEIQQFFEKERLRENNVSDYADIQREVCQDSATLGSTWRDYLFTLLFKIFGKPGTKGNMG